LADIIRPCGDDGVPGYLPWADKYLAAGSKQECDTGKNRSNLILVDGTSLEDIDLVADPNNNVVLIMKDGVSCKSIIHQATGL